MFFMRIHHRLHLLHLISNFRHEFLDTGIDNAQIFFRLVSTVYSKFPNDRLHLLHLSANPRHELLDTGIDGTQIFFRLVSTVFSDFPNFCALFLRTR